MQRVLHAIDYQAARAGSFIAALRRLTSELQKRGYRSLIVAPQASDAQAWVDLFDGNCVQIVRTGSYGGVAHLIRSFQPDIIHTHFSGYRVPATLAAIGRRARVIWHMHGALLPPTSGVRNAARCMKFRLLSRRADAILTVSESLRKELLGMGVPAARLSVVMNGIDTNRFRAPTLAERETARRFLGIEDGCRVLLFFGRDRYIKGADLLASALQAIDAHMRVICVASPPEVVSMMARRAEVISTGSVDDPRPFYWAADALVMPSRYEGTPLTLLEARATGLPAVVSTIPAFEGLLDADDGVVVANHTDPHALAEALMHPMPRRSMSGQARDEISLDMWCEKVLAHYSRLGLSAIA